MDVYIQHAVHVAGFQNLQAGAVRRHGLKLCCVKLIEGYFLVCIDAIARHNAEVAQYHVSTCGQSGDESQDKADSEGLLQLCERTLMALLHCLIGQIQRIRDFLYGHSVIVFHADDIKFLRL